MNVTGLKNGRNFPNEPLQDHMCSFLSLALDAKTILFREQHSVLLYSLSTNSMLKVVMDIYLATSHMIQTEKDNIMVAAALFPL